MGLSCCWCLLGWFVRNIVFVFMPFLLLINVFRRVLRICDFISSFVCVLCTPIELALTQQTVWDFFKKQNPASPVLLGELYNERGGW